MDSTQLTKIGTEVHEVSLTYTDDERNVMGRTLADKIGQLNTIVEQISNLHKTYESQVIALEKQRQDLNKEISIMQTEVSVGEIIKEVECDVYESNTEKIVVKKDTDPLLNTAIFKRIPIESRPVIVDEIPIINDPVVIEEPIVNDPSIIETPIKKI